MSGNARTWEGVVNEDGTFSILARVCALEGTGTEQAVGEGNPLKQADLSAISGKVFSLGTNKNNTAGSAISPDPTIAISSNIFDTLRTVGWTTTEDQYGYNFRLDLGPTYTPSGNEWYLAEIKFTLTSGTIIQLPVKVKTQRIQTS